MARKKRDANEPTIIKKYANRRLYDTGRSSYVTLEDLCEMVQENIDFVVVDAKSGEDITRSILTQIIADQESQEGNNLLPLSFMKNLISFYGDNMQAMVPNYLESTFDIFMNNQEKLRTQINESMKNVAPMNGMDQMNTMFSSGQNIPPALEEMQRQNIAMFENAMKMFTPFATMANTSNKDKK